MENNLSMAISSIDSAIEGNEEEFKQLENLEGRVKRKAKLLKTAHSDLKEAKELLDRGKKEAAEKRVVEADEALRDMVNTEEEEERITLELEELEERDRELTSNAGEALLNLHSGNIGLDDNPG